MDYLFYTCLLLFATDARGVITNSPLNAVAEVGQQAIFNCTSDLPSPNWVLSAKREDLGTTASKTIVYGCVVQTEFTTHYYVDRPGGNINTCNLIVNDTTMHQAGIYTCADTVFGPSAILTVTDSFPAITTNKSNSLITAVENDIVIIECVLNHNGSMSPAPTLRPYFYWTNSSGQNVSSSYDSTTENTAVSQLRVTAGRQDMMPYTCHVYFHLNLSTSTSYANNTPTTTSNASSATIEVFYKPSEIDISRAFSNLTNRKVVCGISQLTCHVTANPMPLYDWFDITNSIDIQLVSDNEQFSFAEDNRTYSCTAYNYIRGIENVVSSTFTVIGSKTSNPPCKFPHNSAMEITADGATCEGRQCKCIEEQPVRLTCIVDAYPIATYQWYMDDMFLTEGASYIATYNGIYICIAAGNVANVAIKSITLINCKTSSEKSETVNPVSENDPSQESTNIAAIVLGVILGLSLSGNVALTFLLVQRRRKEKTIGPSTPNVTSWIEVMKTTGGACDVIVLNCSSMGNPTPQYKWFDVQGSLIGEQHNLTSTDVNLNYTCQAYNTIPNRIHSSSSTYKLPTTDNSTNNSYCTLDTTTQTTANPTDLLTTIVLAAVLGGYGLLNIIATIAFLVYYNHRSNTMNDEHEMSTFKNKAKLNARFPWLQRMLPCMNHCRGNVVCTFLWVKLFIWMSILIGIIVFPILVSIVNCSRKRKNSKEDSDIGMRKVDIDDSQEYTRSSATPSTAAHGDVENPYETVNTVRFHPIQSLEDTTSAKNNNSKEPKKVFYTKVNPNFNPGEEIERYSVSTP